ncbi:MAG TPA: hypothetical protein VHU41_10525, partial [Thermoanaerobaculia bacterium]|nr:hypothetical protein [Thermoanaerobaculia bacterium]
DNYDGTGSATAATDGRPDIIFDIDGSALNAADPTAAPGTLTLATNFKSVTYNRYQIQLFSVGNFVVTASHG